MNFRYFSVSVGLATAFLLSGCQTSHPTATETTNSTTGTTGVPEPAPIGTGAAAPVITAAPANANVGSKITIAGPAVIESSTPDPTTGPTQATTLVFFEDTTSHAVIVETADLGGSNTTGSITVPTPPAGSYVYFIETSHGNGSIPSSGSSGTTVIVPSSPSIAYPLTVH